MPLSANTRLGHYEIKSVLGVGGMGQVYRARDTRLNRDVAIKVLHEDGAASPDQRSRFEREARAVAALNHPNIVSVYDLGVEAGQQYIVSELIEGESLRSLLDGNPLPARKILDVAAQVADGLAAAHAAGIIHRDLKPENIMLAKEGRVKILDFGLARHATSAGSKAVAGDLEPTSAPDGTKHLTHEGTVMGTASYMSPEQAVGKPVDFRTDQFSLGLILYELASGKRAFARNSAVETMAAIVREDPPPLEEKLPAPLKWIIDRCLAKEPEQRYESSRDLFRELRNLRDHFSEAYTSGSIAPIAAKKSKHFRWTLPAAIGATCLLTALSVILLMPSGQDIARYHYTPFASNADSPVWSPDGKAVAYSGTVNGTSQTFLRYLNSPIAIQLTHEKFSTQPLGWSSDRSHLILLGATDRDESPFIKLYSVAAIGGELDFIMDADCDSCDLSRDGQAFAEFTRGKDGVFSVFVSDPLGSPLRPYAPAPFASKDVYGNINSQLHFSPDGKKLMLFRAAGAAQDEAWLLPYPAGNRSPRAVLKNLASPGDPFPEFSWLPDSRHIIVSLGANQGSPDHLWIADIESSSISPVTTGNVSEVNPAVSPDGKSVLYSHNVNQWAIVAVSLDGSSTKTLISTDRRETMAAWSANQPKLTWVTNRNGPEEIWVRLPDGSDRPVVTAQDFPPGSIQFFMNPSLSPDGQRIAYTRCDQAGANYLWMSSLSGGSPVRLTNAQSDGEVGSSWSPDGARVVYLAFAAGQFALKTVKTTGGAAPVILKKSVAEHDLPEWSPAGDWITFHDEDGWSLISPDGKATKSLGRINADYLVFSRDGKLLYGVETGRTEADRDRATLFSLDPATLKRKDIKELGPELIPETNLEPGIRLSLAPDGKSIAYTTARKRRNLWLLQGYRQPGWLSRFTEILK